jgi:hypothetical protein
MRGATPPLPQHAFMAWYSVKCIGTTLTLLLRFNLRKDDDDDDDDDRLKRRPKIVL